MREKRNSGRIALEHGQFERKRLENETKEKHKPEPTKNVVKNSADEKDVLLRNEKKEIYHTTRLIGSTGSSDRCWTDDNLSVYSLITQILIDSKL